MAMKEGKFDRFIKFVVDELTKEAVVVKVNVTDDNINQMFGDYNTFCEWPYVNNYSIEMHMVESKILHASRILNVDGSVLSIKLSVYRKFLKSFFIVIEEKYGVRPTDSLKIYAAFMDKMVKRSQIEHKFFERQSFINGLIVHSNL